MNDIAPPRPDRSTTYEIGLLSLISLGVIVLLGMGVYGATKSSMPFDPSAYLVVLTLIVGAIKERWLSRSVDRMGQKLADASPPASDPAPQSAVDAANQTAAAATDEAAAIGERATT